MLDDEKHFHDPVCKMDMIEEDAFDRVVHDGVLYLFCSEVCKGEFSRNPEKYVDPDLAPERRDVA